MLGFYSALGRRLKAYRMALWCLVALSVLVFLGSVFSGRTATDQTYTLGSIILLLWSLSLIVLVQAFSAPAPRVEPGGPLGQRIRARLARGLRWFLAATTTGLFGLVILLSLKAAGILLRG